jgi:cell division protein ZapE
MGKGHHLAFMLHRWQELLGSPEEKPRAPRGIYMWGGVGTGKTMLMDLLAESAPPEFQARRPHIDGLQVERQLICML